MTDEEMILIKYHALDDRAKRRVLRTVQGEYEDLIERRLKEMRNGLEVMRNGKETHAGRNEEI